MKNDKHGDMATMILMGLPATSKKAGEYRKGKKKKGKHDEEEDERE